MNINVWYFDEDKYIEKANNPRKIIVDDRTISIYPWDINWDYCFYEKEIEVSTYNEFEIILCDEELSKYYINKGIYKFIEIDYDYIWIDYSINSYSKNFSWKSIKKWEETRNFFVKDNQTYFNDVTKIIERDIKLKELLNDR